MTSCTVPLWSVDVVAGNMGLYMGFGFGNG